MAKRVAVVVNLVPHYRKAVYSALNKSDSGYEYVFFAGDNSTDRTIKTSESGSFVERRLLTWHFRGVFFQFGLLRSLLKNEFDFFVFMGNPYFVTTWIYALAARLSGKTVLFWTHGWLRDESGLKKIIRRKFYSLADGLLLYGDRALEIGIKSGFSGEKCFVIYNSLDYDLQKEVRSRLKEEAFDSKFSFLVSDSTPYVSCIARLTNECGFELAIDALALIRERDGRSVPLVLIGDGPRRSYLEEYGKQKSVQVVFLGALYEEADIGPILFHSRAVVSPGKVGLTAMHALAYGTPVITHADFESQGPEVEAIKDGITGSLFSKGDVAALADSILYWVGKRRTQQERNCCVRVIEDRYTPAKQVELIESALKNF